tara:strand:- start:741 stop:1037 length:297 start_codon:yes stop_codon:yes gene_type:complete
MEHAIDINADGQPLESRDQARRRTLKSGRIELKNQASTIDVTIRDMSLSGALLLLKDVWTPPAEFGLLVLNPNNGKTQRHACLKVWQKGTMVGVRFLV